jgi:hypothetical protein
MATELFNELVSRASGLAPEERRRLARVLSQNDGNGETAFVEGERALNAAGLHSQKREQHIAWLKAHRNEYSGRYVALDGDQLMGNGRTIREATARAKENGCDSPFVVYVLSSEVVADGGL